MSQMDTRSSFNKCFQHFSDEWGNSGNYNDKKWGCLVNLRLCNLRYVPCIWKWETQALKENKNVSSKLSTEQVKVCHFSDLVHQKLTLLSLNKFTPSSDFLLDGVTPAASANFLINIHENVRFTYGTIRGFRGNWLGLLPESLNPSISCSFKNCNASAAWSSVISWRLAPYA